MLDQFAAGLLLAAVGTSSASAGLGVEWQWVPDAESCELRQQIDEAGRFFQISRTPGSDQTPIALFDGGAKAKSWKPIKEATITLEPGGSMMANGSIGPGEVPGSRRTITASIDDQEFLDKFSSANGVVVSHKAIGSVRAPLRSSAEAVQALRKCEDEKMREWGIDSTAWRALKVRPIPLAQTYSWFTTGDYPYLAAMYRVSGLVIARIEVGPDGRVQNCTIVNRQLYSVFRDATCNALKRNGRFRSALDATGQPTSAPYVVRVRFEANP